MRYSVNKWSGKVNNHDEYYDVKIGIFIFVYKLITHNVIIFYND